MLTLEPGVVNGFLSRLLRSHTTSSISFPSPRFEPVDPAQASQHVRFPGNTDSSCVPAARSHHTIHLPLPSFSRLPLLSTTTLANNQNLLMPAPPLVSAALTPPQLTYSARMRTQSIAPPVLSFLNLAGESRILPVQGRTGCDASTLPCSRIRHRDSTLPQFRYFMLNEK
jgi:hypothetical protein